MTMAVGRGQLTGTAGEYFVAAELSLRGWLATVTIKNTPGIDILAKYPPSGQTATIQVKTTSKPSGRFILSVKDEATTKANDEWYVFVVLREPGQRPNFYVVPRNVVAGYLYSRYQDWKDRPERRSPGKEVSTRDVDATHLGGFEDNWALMQRPATEAPLLVDDWLLEIAARHPRPDVGYPGYSAQRPSR